MGGGVDRHFQRVILAGPVILHEVVHSLFDAIAWVGQMVSVLHKFYYLCIECEIGKPKIISIDIP